MISFSRSTRGDFRNSLFDTRNTEMSKQRKEYIIELLAVCLDNVMEFHIAGEFKSDKTKEGFKTAVYRTSLYMSEWFNGTIIQEILKDKATDEEMTIFCESYGVSKRMHTAIGNIKSCEKAVLDIFNNYKEVLSNENISKILKDIATDEEMEVFCESYGVSNRMHTAIGNIKSCEKAVLDIFNNYKEVLSNENISKVLKDIATAEEIEVFCESYGVSRRMHTAIHNVKSCEQAVLELFVGQISLGGKMFYQRREGIFKHKS
jgi:DNA-directed RNA polymerase subunit N (RpoN/RPB10)